MLPVAPAGPISSLILTANSANSSASLFFLPHLQIYLAMYPLRSEEYVWEGPDCVKNLLLDTVKHCPEEGDEQAAKAGGGDKGKGGEAKPATTAAATTTATATATAAAAEREADEEAAAAEAAVKAEEEAR